MARALGQGRARLTVLQDSARVAEFKDLESREKKIKKGVELMFPLTVESPHP